MKALPAIIFALVMTAVVGVAMLAVGANAMLNKNSTPVLSSPAAASGTVSNVNFSTDQQQVAQMQQLISQYQAREKQYQTELDQAAQRLNEANQQVQFYQQVLDQLQQMGILRIDQNGQIYLRNRGGDGG